MPGRGHSLNGGSAAPWRGGAFRERPVELDAVWRGDSTNPALLRLLRDVLPQREWTTDDLVEDVLG